MSNNRTSARIERFVLKLPLYVRIGFGLLTLFGLVGNCAGHTEGSLAIFVMGAIAWVNMRIIEEAITSWRLLSIIAEHSKKNQANVLHHDDDDSNPPGPVNPAT